MKTKDSLLGLGSAIVLLASAAQAWAQQPGVAICRDSADRRVTTCRIDQPVVDQRAKNGFPYKNVVFRPGDLVTVTAGGCVQTGGWHLTWKRYVDPKGDDSQRFYSGTIRIPGVIPPGAAGDLKAWIGRAVRIPAGVGPPDNFLILGYKDDDYSDNGYGGHDDGNFDQCKEGRGLDGGPAWLVATIEHGGGGNADIPAPFDLVADAVDANGLPLNPRWGWEADPASRNPPHSNGKEAVTDPGPDPTQLCDGFRYLSGVDRDPTKGVTLGSPPCSTQVGSNSFDDPSGEEPNDTGCKVFGPGNGLLHGHMNWWPATVTGIVQWAGHMSGLQLGANWPFEHHGDDDYCFYLFPVNGGGLFPHTTMSLGTLSRPNFIEAEMDSDETVDDFGSKWWNNFHTEVDSWKPEWENANLLAPASKRINWHEASITGLVNIDQEHESGHAELHPIYALAIHLNDGSTEFPRDANNDGWAIFARNWGDEGYCSKDQHYWDVSSVSIFIPEQIPASDYEILELDLSANKPVNAQHEKVAGGLVLKFDLGVPENRAMVDGSIRIRWVPSGAGPATHPELTHPGGATTGPGALLLPAVVARSAPEQGEKGLDLLKGLPPEKVAELLQQIKKPPVAKHAYKVQAVRSATSSAEAPHAAAHAQISRPRVRTVRDPVAEAERNRQLQVLCAAHANAIPSLPQACVSDVRDHRQPTPGAVRDHREPTPNVRDHRPPG